MLNKRNNLQILQPFKGASIKNKNLPKRKIMAIYQTFLKKAKDRFI